MLTHEKQIKAGVASRPHLGDMLVEALDHRRARWMLFRHDQAEFHTSLRSCNGLSFAFQCTLQAPKVHL